MVGRQLNALKLKTKKKEDSIAAGLISDRFHSVLGIVIHMKYFRRGANPFVMERTLNIFPSSYAFFKMDCITRGCEGGGFDLTSIVDDMIKRREKTRKGEIVCCGKVNANSADHASIEYEAVVKYSRAS